MRPQTIHGKRRGAGSIGVPTIRRVQVIVTVLDGQRVHRTLTRLVMKKPILATNTAGVDTVRTTQRGEERRNGLSKMVILKILEKRRMRTNDRGGMPAMKPMRDIAGRIVTREGRERMMVKTLMQDVTRRIVAREDHEGMVVTTPMKDIAGRITPRGDREGMIATTLMKDVARRIATGGVHGKNGVEIMIGKSADLTERSLVVRGIRARK